jgi:hypothetical protein
MTKTPPPPRWSRRWFGEEAVFLSTAIPRALATAHKRGQGAHDGGEMETKDAYGTTVFVKQYEELSKAIASVEGARTTRLGRHPLAIYNNFVFYPWRYAADGVTSVRGARFRLPLSFRRKRLFVAHGPNPMQPALHPDFEMPYVEELRQAFPELGAETKLVLIAYASAVDTGVLNAFWGDAELTASGEVLWHHLSKLPEPSSESGTGGAEGGRTKLGPVPPKPDTSTGGQRFDAGSMPELNFPPRPRPVDAPSSEAEPNTAEADVNELD